MSLKKKEKKDINILLNKVQILPKEPGCYLFKNYLNNVIYIGKSKNLFNRVKSYFSAGNHNQKTSDLMKEVCDFEYIITNNEIEAFLLEANLIKQHLPKYNFKLLDDKNYIYIEITREKHPRLKMSYYKNIPSDKIIFGPYPKSESARETVRLLQKIYPLRRCNPIAQKPCNYYQINECLGPCRNDGQNIDYSTNIKNINDFLKGKNKNIIKKVEKEMKKASSELKYERAMEYKKIFYHLKNVIIKQVINLNKNTSNYDIIGLDYDSNEISIYILRMNQGNIFDHYQIVFSYIDDPIDNFITYLNLYYQNNILPQEIILSKKLLNFKNKIQKIIKTRISFPLIQEKEKLYQLAKKNAEENLNKYNLLYRFKFEFVEKALKELSHLFNKNINYIEVFDISNLFQQFFVGGMIVFRNYSFQKKYYRSFRINIETPNEYSCLESIIKLRYQKLKNLQLKLPDLILVDGGIGQFNISYKILNSLFKDFELGSLKKNDKHQLESLIIQNKEIFLDKKSSLFRFLLSLSEEVHNFTIRFHRKIKKTEDTYNILSLIPDLGIKKYQLLLKNFSNLDEIKNASFQDLKKFNISNKIIEKIKKI
ncbi:MAG: excinuclease ABC subunit UvrC [Candidatus Phytoplasma stylosanthis]|uniref:excinuclease ABC subunit UvrC n=1 Tax=Candidatus Phytoplasma stylosanthis TaxID=2798314 RepID=UPI00293979CE|nr:excinuclease ABC subunit UvrC [Candidatus Phytoplasma stylosanthis]MDV3167989.1 excinuclease ABC subunit UvrC [Candidatus Phytoplasma stylosanthis]MDV3170790.1 excinuclease ABC subunit UvrC [Candidatus Phytoplasma stylosanthis]MDV3174196.1 excinuclease ABC subunit UvrC [Candidatus Phytoplasma stylosanthis]MDV3202513.1 excinuclease ABC subunit UvrC [Candidatus Phytoplasma stylosanthis]